MSRLARVLFTVAILASSATTAFAADKYPPGPPYRFCPDSVTIFQVQQSDTLLNPCFPAIGDTLLGVSGIVTGKRLRSTARLYIENSNAADFNGLQIYVSDQTYNSQFVLGDSVVAYGLSQYYQNESQIQGALGTSLVVRKISGGNPLPPFRMCTTTDLRYTPATGSGSAYVTANPLEGMLVKVNGPLRVARIETVSIANNGLYAGTNWLLVNADGSAPGDSILIDGYTLTAANILNPPLNYVVDWVQGILRRATNDGLDSWVVTLRDVNDQSLMAPPNLSEAFPIAENKLRIIFDSNVDVPTAENEANYQLGSTLSGSSVDLAEVVGGAGNLVDLTVTEVQPRLTLETISTQNIGSEDCPVCLSSQQSLSFILGVLTPAEIQVPDPDSLADLTCLDRSRFAGLGYSQGTRLTARGVFVQKYGSLFYIEGAAGGLRNGVSVYNSPFAMTQGQEYLVAARTQEYYTETELSNVVAVIDVGTSAVPAPILETVGVLSDGGCDPTQTITNAEDYEGLLVRVENVKVVPFNTEPTIPSTGGTFRVVGPYPTWDDTILVSSLGNTYPDYTPVVGTILNVNGVIHIDNDVPRILPRSSADITSGTVDVTPGGTLALSLSVEPNPGITQRVSFVVPRRDKVEVGVYDLLGRRVAVLARGEMPAGSYTREWDGLAADGSRVTSGVYFYRLTVGGESRTVRAIKLN